jgi:hypothetical protein
MTVSPVNYAGLEFLPGREAPTSRALLAFIATFHQSSYLVLGRGPPSPRFSASAPLRQMPLLAGPSGLAEPRLSGPLLGPLRYPVTVRDIAYHPVPWRPAVPSTTPRGTCFTPQVCFYQLHCPISASTRSAALFNPRKYAFSCAVQPPQICFQLHCSIPASIQLVFESTMLWLPHLFEGVVTSTEKSAQRNCEHNGALSFCRRSAITLTSPGRLA